MLDFFGYSWKNQQMLLGCSKIYYTDGRLIRKECLNSCLESPLVVGDPGLWAEVPVSRGEV